MYKIIIVLVALLTVNTGWSQDEDKMIEGMREPMQIISSETSVKIKKDTKKAQTVYVYGEPKELEKHFVEYFQNKYTCEIKKEKGFYIASDIKMSDVTDETVNLIGQIVEDERGAKLNVMVDLGTTFLNESDHSAEVAKLKMVVKNFVSDFYVGWYAEVIDDERKDFEKSEKELERLTKDGEKLSKDLNSKTEKATKSEEEIVKAEKSIADLQIKIEELKANINNLKSEKELLRDSIEKNKKETSEKQSQVNKKSADLEKLKTNADRLKTSN